MSVPLATKDVFDYTGGLNLRVDPSKLAPNEYPLLLNGRTRFGFVEPIKQQLEDARVGELGGTTIQGYHVARNLLFIFKEGKAYFKDYSINSNWAQVRGFQMAVTGPIYTAQVTASYNNFVRQAGTSADKPIILTNNGDASAACIVCQDGVNQPMLIQPDGTCRQAGSYESWNLDSREYVPIGKQMLFHLGILLIVSPDGTVIYRSVTGRPLDFMVVVDVNNNKLVNKDAGDAFSVGHRVSYEPITAIKSINTIDNSFYVSTLNASFSVTPDYNFTIFGEPTFITTKLFEYGCVSNESVIDTLNLTTFATKRGLHAFNSVRSQRIESANEVFNANLMRLFPFGIYQVDVAAGIFDDYVFYAMNTVYGNTVLVFDLVLDKFVSLDFYNGIAKVKYFATIHTDQVYKLLIISEDGRLFEFGAGPEFENCTIYIGDMASSSAMEQLKPQHLHLRFVDVFQPGTVYATMVSDRQAVLTLQESISTSRTSPLLQPITLANDSDDSYDTAKAISFNLLETNQASKIGVRISWNFNAKLANFTLECARHIKQNARESTAQDSYVYKRGLPSISSVDRTSGVSSGNWITFRGLNLRNIGYVTVGTIRLNLNDLVLVNDTTLKFLVTDAMSSSVVRCFTSNNYEIYAFNITII